MPRVIGDTQAAHARCINYRTFSIKTRGSLCTEPGLPVGDITPLCLQTKFSDCHNHRFCLIFFDNFLYYIHFEITGYRCNLIGSQRCDFHGN